MEKWSVWIALGLIYFVIGRISGMGTTQSIRMPQWLASLFNWPRPKYMPKRAVSGMGLGLQAAVLVMILYRLVVEGAGLSGWAFDFPEAFIGFVGSPLVGTLIARQLQKISPYPLPIAIVEFYLGKIPPTTSLVRIMADELNINPSDFEIIQSFDSEEDWLMSSHPRLWMSCFAKGNFPIGVKVIVSSIDIEDHFSGTDLKGVLSRIARRLNTKLISPFDKNDQRNLYTWTLFEEAGRIRHVKPNRELLVSEDFGIEVEEFLD